MYLIVKRILDILISSMVLILFLPIFIIIAFALLCTAKHEVFYFQKRIGKGSNYFDIWKFATMLKDSPNLGTGMITLRNDPRVTPMGGFLRKTKINELPQVINVLKGDMSLVGPRPTVKKHADAYGPELRDIIYSIKPGITGLGSIIFRDEEELISNSDMEPFEYYQSIIIPYKVKLEKWYNTNRSFWVDLKIIFATARVILQPKSKIVYSWFKELPKRPF